MVMNPPAMQETQVGSLGQEDPLKKEMATHSSTLAWRIPWTEEPRRALDLTEQLTLTFFHFHGNNAKEGSWIFFLTTV